MGPLPQLGDVITRYGSSLPVQRYGPGFSSFSDNLRNRRAVEAEVMNLKINQFLYPQSMVDPNV